MGGMAGEEPEQMIAWWNSTGRPSIVALCRPVNVRSPDSTRTPAASKDSGESTGSMVRIADRTLSITFTKSTETPSTRTPRREEVRAFAARAAAAKMALDGTHPVHKQSPPVRSRSTKSTRAPKLAAVR